MAANRPLPEKGTIWQELEHELAELRSRDAPWGKGIFHDYWPNGGSALQMVSAEASKQFTHHLWLGRFSQPSLVEMGTQLEAMVMDILDAPEGSGCTFTAGGTETNFLAVLAAREWARERRPGAGTPEILMSRSTHPSFDKAAHYLGMTVNRVPVADNLRADPEAMAAAVTENTVMIVGSAPPYPHGQIDPIESIAQIAREHGLWCHVDGCVGGFLLPFLREIGHEIPASDLNVDGVMSMSADLHKYAYAPHGMSALLLRDAKHVRLHEHDFDNWSMGRFRVPGVMGTRGGAPLAGAWATFRFLGREGFIELARGVERSTKRMRAGIEAIDGLKLLAEPEAGVFTFLSDEFDIEAVAEAMTEAGYSSSVCREPTAMHLLMEPVEDESLVEKYLETLKSAVDKVRSSGRQAAGGKFSYA